MFFLFTFILSLFCVLASAQMPAFDSVTPPPAPEYSDTKYWSALPFRSDDADKIPSSETWVSDSLKTVDVFYIYPTMFRKGKTWNADVNNKRLNKKIDRKPVRFQASAFNESCRVYAPRYRQAIVKVFFKKTDDGEKALNLAYQDVKQAFDYYLKNFNQGRPIIIASHSQGTRLSRRLLKEYFDGTPLQKQLVAAYAIGFTINESMYSQLKLCKQPDETGCYVSWVSYKMGYDPKKSFFKNTECVNPLTWTTDTAMVETSESKGAILLGFKKKYSNANSVKVCGQENSILWVDTKVPIFRRMDNLHIADYNLFWYDIRSNVRERIHSFTNERRVLNQ